MFTSNWREDTSCCCVLFWQSGSYSSDVSSFAAISWMYACRVARPIASRLCVVDRALIESGAFTTTLKVVEASCIGSSFLLSTMFTLSFFCSGDFLDVCPCF